MSLSENACVFQNYVKIQTHPKPLNANRDANRDSNRLVFSLGRARMLPWSDTITILSTCLLKKTYRSI